MAAVLHKLRQSTKSHFFRRGAPFLICVIAGSFALKQFATIRYDFRKGKKITNEEAAKYGLQKKEPRSLEELYEEHEKEDLDQWENIRGPRPWEDSKTVQDEQRKAMSMRTT